jgi:putative restriction endonuclease
VESTRLRTVCSSVPISTGFDLGYVTVSPAGRFEVSSRLKADFDNGRHYYDLHGTPIRPPKSRDATPSVDALSWHREYRYLG